MAPSTSAITGVIIASASTVAKTFLIGSLGYYAVKRPKSNPLLPTPQDVAMVSRMSYTILMLPLCFTGVASTVTLHNIQELWLILIGAWMIIGISYWVGTLLAFLPYFQVVREDVHRFRSLRIATSFPNIVALPVLIFPTLCEYEVVYSTFYDYTISTDTSTTTTSTTGNDFNKNDAMDDVMRIESMDACVKESYAVIMTYFLGFSSLFFSFGYRSLLKAAKGDKEMNNANVDTTSFGCDNENELEPIVTNGNVNHHDHGMTAITSLSSEIEMNDMDNRNNSPISISPPNEINSEINSNIHRDKSSDNSSSSSSSSTSLTSSATLSTCQNILSIIKDVISQSGFIAVVLGFIVSCIPPLQNSLFSVGGELRFIGSALESLSEAAGIFANIIAASGLGCVTTTSHSSAAAASTNNSTSSTSFVEQGEDVTSSAEPIINNDMTTIESTSSIIPSSPSSSSSPVLTKLQKLQILFQSLSFKVHTWHILTRLILTPAIILSILYGLDQIGESSNSSSSLTIPYISNYAKVILLVNSASPGALVVVMILQAEGMHETAELISRTYLPSYLICIFTMAVWTAVGLLVFVQ